MGYSEMFALSVTCLLLVFTTITTFSLLVKYDDAGSELFPGCLLIYYTIQTYKRCESLLTGQRIDPSKFTFKTILFSYL